MSTETISLSWTRLSLLAGCAIAPTARAGASSTRSISWQELAGPRTTRIPNEMLEAVWREHGQELDLDALGHERAARSPKTQKSDDPVLQIRALFA